MPGTATQRIEFTVDCINVLNLINSEWGRVQTVPLERDQLLRFEGWVNPANAGVVNAPVGTPMFSFTDKKNPFQFDDLRSRWQIQFGARYSF